MKTLLIILLGIFEKNNRSGQRSCHYRARRDLKLFINSEKKFQQF